MVEYNLDYVTLSWIAPEHDGGSPILSYIVEKRDSMMNMWSQAAKLDSSTFTVKVTNLFEGQNYLFRVAAENQCGRGAYIELAKPVLTKLPFGKFTLYCMFITAILSYPSSLPLSSLIILLKVDCFHKSQLFCVDEH